MLEISTNSSVTEGTECAAVYLVGVDPRDDFVALVEHSLAIVVTDLVLQLVVFHRLFHVERVALQRVLRLKTVSLSVVLLLVLLRVVYHLLDLFLAQPT